MQMQSVTRIVYTVVLLHLYHFAVWSINYIGIGQTAIRCRCYMTKILNTRQKYIMTYDVDINSTGKKTWLSFNLSIVYQVSWLMAVGFVVYIRRFIYKF